MRRGMSVCGWCECGVVQGLFCVDCYSLLDGVTKNRIRAAVKFGSPDRARLYGRETLAALAASGGRMPARGSRARALV